MNDRVVTEQIHSKSGASGRKTVGNRHKRSVDCKEDLQCKIV